MIRTPLLVKIIHRLKVIAIFFIGIISILITLQTFSQAKTDNSYEKKKFYF
jgi:hypothetical protein